MEYQRFDGLPCTCHRSLSVYLYLAISFGRSEWFWPRWLLTVFLRSSTETVGRSFTDYPNETIAHVYKVKPTESSSAYNIGGDGRMIRPWLDRNPGRPTQSYYRAFVIVSLIHNLPSQSSAADLKGHDQSACQPAVVPVAHRVVT